MNRVPDVRIRVVNDMPPRADGKHEGDYVLYWMIAFRRPRYNFSLQRAVEWAKKLEKPLVIMEGLQCDYRWASDRLHRFVIEGMADNAAHFANKPVLYYPYVEPDHRAGQGLLKELASRAAVVISDDFPCFFLPRMIRLIRRVIPCRFEVVDSNGLLPMRAADKVFARAYDFRRFLQKNLLPHLAEIPKPDPLSRIKLPEPTSLPTSITKRWPAADPSAILTDANGLAVLPIDHSVQPTETTGGWQAAEGAWRAFLKHRLPIYASERNHPDEQAASGLSPYLHFGHIAAHQVFDELTEQVQWTPGQVAEKATGSSSGWWGAEEQVESFLDELITWRELGFNICWQREDYEQYESLPEWAQRTLAEHADDKRKTIYTLEQFEQADTHDEIWNAAQRQLVEEGRIHNYLRMLWGKKILEWTASPREALQIMIELNNKYALDGRDPNSYSGIFWVLGRYDRAWGPERPIFGKIRYMSSDNTKRKLRMKEYLQKFAESR
ncbi:deoxyribodipyrimidine photolyase [Roseimaritima ulvae]|uniref:Deoxyribodipyrimidine photo-lyase n=1 Tax=Roseimaritima ulvae TaxID=980254 RepID=A0A5B9QPM5_9BACT|nr:deoxyribodipyrimidine photolyase [Roseimaritima ulvae]QEG40968.1 deoxyribodipyrimidine photolyase [Roseimaritima ulvae]